jgi:hypothetical protein
MGPRGLLRAAFVAGTLAVISLSFSGTAVAGPPRVEAAWFEGQLVHFVQPAVFSADRNGGTFACFGLGPDLSTTSRSAATPPIYIILNDFATQDHCDGDAAALRHDHVLSTAPGHAGYTGSWALVLAVPGPAFDPAQMPFTSVAQVQAGVALGELVLVDTGASMIAPVIRGAP